jgi:1,4-alpha-glucan branching enzyme
MLHDVAATARATSQDHVDDRTPMGATLVKGGATFRVWAPRAGEVYIVTDDLPAALAAGPSWRPKDRDRLVGRPDGTWAGFVPGIRDGDAYRFWVAGEAGSGFKRDPYARELGTYPPFPNCDCLVRAHDTYPWHDAGFIPPSAPDLVIYQLHVGTFHGTDAQGRDTRLERTGTFLDVLFRLEELRDLGVTALQLLPVQEYPSEFSMGYNGTDYFSPETDYQVDDADALRRYLAEANRHLAAHGRPRLAEAELAPGPNQLKCLIDICHLKGMAVILDLVFNHAGGGFDDQSLYFFDRKHFTSNNDSLYFTDQGWAGGLIFAYWSPQVRQFLIDNALFWLDEYHADGIRYDEVSVIDNFGGWRFAQDLASTVRFAQPASFQIAEYWNDWRWLAVRPPPDGLGFDSALSDRMRDSVRKALREASVGGDGPIDMTGIAGSIGAPPNFPSPLDAVQCLENHDVVYHNRPPHDWQPRIPLLADGNDPRSWWARSRSRVATGLLLTAPGIPMLFMGQEVLEARNWSDNPRLSPDTLILWDQAAGDGVRRDHRAFTRDLLALRRTRAALRWGSARVSHAHDANRILAFHRWIEAGGEDVMVVASLRDANFNGYDIGFPCPGRWREVFNSDFYDGLPNPQVAGNGGAVEAGGPPLHGFACSASLTIPANAILVFARA